MHFMHSCLVIESSFKIAFNTWKIGREISFIVPLTDQYNIAWTSSIRSKTLIITLHNVAYRAQNF